MDSIMILLQNKFKNFECIEEYRKTQNGCEIKTKEGIRYSCYVEFDKNIRLYYLCNSYYEKRCKLSIKTMSSLYFDENIVPDIFEKYILENEILYSAFKDGIKAFKERNINYNISSILNNDTYLQYSKENELDNLIYYVWNKGYEYSSKFPDPDIVYEQYNYLKKRALEKININTILEFMIRNEDIHIYLDEKPVSEKAKELNNVKEIEYSYGHIVAKAKTYNIKMNLLPLDGEILVFDTEGINEIARCNVDYYSIEYENKSIYEMFKSIKNYEMENLIDIKKEKEENEEEE